MRTPNKAAPVNAPIAPCIRFGHPRWRVTERRWAQIVMQSCTGSKLLATGLFLCLLGCSHSGSGNVPPLLTAAGLAPLPLSATKVTYYHWAGMGTDNAYVRFEVSPGDFYLFLSNSPALREKQPTKHFDKKHQHLSIPQSSWRASLPQDHDYYLEGPSDPKWFRPTVLGSGRLYKIDFNLVTWVLFDEDKHVIWLFTSRG